MSNEQDIIEREHRERVMRSSTFRALAALEPTHPHEWEADYLDEVVENVEAIDRVRWWERVIWGAVVVITGIGAFMAGWMMRPIPEPEPIQWQCDVKVRGAEDEVRCAGVGEQ